MKTSAGFGKLTAIVAIGAFLASSTAMAQGQPVCRGGILTDAGSGAPLYDPQHHQIPCRAVEAEDGSLGGYVIAGTVLAGLLAVGLCAGPGRCFRSNDGYWFVPTGGNNNRSSATTF